MEPEELEQKEFLISLRGYDRDEVDRFLKELADELRSLRAQAGSPREITEATAESGADAVAAYRRIGEETSNILVAAEQAGTEIRDRAKREAAEIVAAARAEATEVSRAIDEARSAAEKDLEGLQQARSLLATQLEDVKRRLEETIGRLQAPLVDMPPKRTSSLPSAVSPTAVTPSKRSRGAEPEVKPKVEEVKVEDSLPKAPTSASVEAPVVDVVDVTDGQATLESDEAAPVGTETLEQLLEEIRREREASKKEVDEVIEALESKEIVSAPSEPVREVLVPVSGVANALTQRQEVLGDSPSSAARRLKRLLQEDQNDLLDRIRTTRAKGSFEETISPESDQVERFRDGLTELLASAFLAGRKVAGSPDDVSADETVLSLVTKQLVLPLRKELSRVVDAGIEAQDTPTAIAERASDVYRVWKGVRTELLGEGLVYSAFHQGLIDVWRKVGAAQKVWVLDEEDQCPRDLCKVNADAGSVALDSAFPSGHLAPPAHGGCTCTLTSSEGVG